MSVTCHIFLSSLEADFKKQLSKIQNGVQKFQLQLRDVKPTPELIEKLKEIMSEVETSITSLKEDQRTKFEELLKEERTYRQEITAYDKKIENWNICVTTECRPRTSTVSKVQYIYLPSEVKALELYLNKTGGSSGGWDQFDHQTFLKVWTKFRGQPAYRKEAKLFLPSKTEEEIQQHEDWYRELIHLQDKKKEVRHTEERRRQLEVKLIIEEQLRLKREEEEKEQRRQREEETREMEERRREATRGIKKFNERVEGHVSRDPSRLTRPTKGWEERMKNIGPSGSGPVLQMFHRAVPTWRQGL
uniref:Uncharacterized protein n=1 Tax=Periophthalmus magnuspinnatus TaxID=409849 RepID=A0A3B4AZE6_9GOBI